MAEAKSAMVERLVDAALVAARKELMRAIGMYGPFRGPHEGFAVLKEEVDELWDDVKSNQPETIMRKEATQVAAMALRFIVDVCDGVGLETTQERLALLNLAVIAAEIADHGGSPEDQARAITERLSPAVDTVKALLARPT